MFSIDVEWSPVVLLRREVVHHSIEQPVDVRSIE